MSENDTEFVTTDDNKVEEDRVKLDLYDANKGLLKRDGGPYLDQVERERDEVVRAAKEKRDPDLANPPANAGTVLVPKHYLRETDASTSHVSAAAELENSPEATVYPDVHDPFDDEPDPNQVNWDNDHQKVAAQQGLVAYDEASKKAKDVDTSSPDPVAIDAPEQPDASGNNENVVTGVGTTVWNDSAPDTTKSTDDTTDWNK